MRFTSISKARETLRLMDESREEVMVMRDNEPVAVMMPVDHYQALRAMVAFASDAQGEAQMEYLHAQTIAGDVDADDIEDYDTHRAERGQVGLVQG